MMAANMPIHVLHFTTRLSAGGVQTFLVNYATHMETNKIVFDFAVQTSEPQRYDREMQDLGGRIFPLHSMSDSIVKYFVDVFKLCKSHPEIQVVHSHLNYRNFIPLFAARLAGVPIRISHSHSAYNSESRLKTYARKMFQTFLPIFATELCGCSEKAIQWLYGKYSPRASVVHNAINTQNYLFDEKKRQRMRNKLSLCEQDIVLIHVGTFGHAKNHDFLLRMFAEYRKHIVNAKLLLCGDGSLRDMIEATIKELEIANSVILVGMTDHVSDYLMAADVFVLPSLYEGLALSTVEAQASGLPCVVSSAVPDEAIFMENVRIVDQFELSIWCNMIEELRSGSINRCDGAGKARQAGFDIEQEASKLEKWYLTLTEKSRK